MTETKKVVQKKNSVDLQVLLKPKSALSNKLKTESRSNRTLNISLDEVKAAPATVNVKFRDKAELVGSFLESLMKIIVQYKHCTLKREVSENNSTFTDVTSSSPILDTVIRKSMSWQPSFSSTDEQGNCNLFLYSLTIYC